ncbi:MAG: pyridoxamine 5'-phosphate oxidase family protein [Ramlibacter sp.]|nr:pyridoxamine 5'-phosphate oxidase family protein [Ramlibacter sp.]
MSPGGYPLIERPFHEGEQALQRRAGSFAKLDAIGPQVIRSFMPDQHRSFFAQLPFVVVGSVDAGGQPWASLLAGPPGFAHSPDPQQLVVQAKPVPGDPLAAALVPGAALGLLGIEPPTRRRNRMNGLVSAVDSQGFTVRVSQSFGNCPKYIQAREGRYTGPAMPGPVQELSTLDPAARRLLQAADTFFIATAHPTVSGDATQGVDVSHRGGKPGFVQVLDDGSLVVPDFVGNHFFNTLGNLALNPPCGLAFVDFERGDVVQVAANGFVLWDDEHLRDYPGAPRLLRFEVLAVRRLATALPLQWGEAELSPVLAPTGPWLSR